MAEQQTGSQGKAKSGRGSQQGSRARHKVTRVRSIADAVVIKDSDLFFLSEPGGQVPLGGDHGLGLFYHDCRFLDGYEFSLGGGRPEPLAATQIRGYTAMLELTNPPLRGPSRRRVHAHDIGVHWSRVIDGADLAFYDHFTFHNYGMDAAEFPVALAFSAGFKDIFVIRGMSGETLGTADPPRWDGGALYFLYDGSDGVRRGTSVHFRPAPEATEKTTARFTINVPPGESRELRVSLLIAESPGGAEVTRKLSHGPDPGEIRKRLQASSDQWLGERTRFECDSRALAETMDRSLRDLRLLHTKLNGQEYFAGGVPWYVTLFGRDSLITAMETLAFQPQVAAPTLRLLAHYQGTKKDDWRDEEPGKIPHELRVGELANKDAIPFTPYYGTVDATPLFLMLVAKSAAWSGDLGLFHELRDNVERALGWIAHNLGDDGFLQYTGSASGHGLSNQGWKDSGDAIVNADGSLAKPPIALAEVQGYVYQAKLGIADLFERDGDADRARRLREEASSLRERFNHDYWLGDKNFYAMARQAQGKPCAVIASNPGQALWTGIVTEERAPAVVGHLTANDMFTGWGVRTLSAGERRYNPLGYHLGTVWPHDNALIAAGFRRYGQDGAFLRVIDGILQAATHLHAYRLPELFAGFRRGEFTVPVRYPVACHPQAWAAGSAPFLLETALGLVPEGFEQRLRVVRPLLPREVNRIELKGLRVGRGKADLRFLHTGGQRVRVEVLSTEGGLDVVVDK